MNRTIQSFRYLLTLMAAPVLAACSVSAWAQSSPDELLDRMNQVVTVTDYEGTVVRWENGESEALKIVHKIIDGVINEKLMTQEGNGLEIIRIGNNVHCILPDKQTVLIEEWNNQRKFAMVPCTTSLLFAVTGSPADQQLCWLFGHTTNFVTGIVSGSTRKPPFLSKPR
jgi:negative regulator of sigma E activity